jgi:hypothetical protein
MNVKIYKMANRHKLCWVTVSRIEAVALINSLTNQILANNPNIGRQETICDDDSDLQEISVVIRD